MKEESQDGFNKILVVDESICEADSEYEEIFQVVKEKVEAGEPITLQDFPSVQTQEIYIKEMSNGLANVISCMELKKEDAILEIHSGFGQGTKYLLNYTEDVTCIDESMVKSRINCMRNHAFKAVYVGEAGNCLDKIETKFDKIIIWELPVSDLEEFFSRIKEHLAPGGSIYLLFTNKYSILRLSKLEKDSAGAYAYMPDRNLYTKDYVTDILNRTGFQNIDLYFPYPDYRYTMAMYSVDRLPVVGELNKNQFRFSSQDIPFTEHMDSLFDQIVKDGMFGQLANAYMLVIKGHEDE